MSSDSIRSATRPASAGRPRAPACRSPRRGRRGRRCARRRGSPRALGDALVAQQQSIACRPMSNLGGGARDDAAARLVHRRQLDDEAVEERRAPADVCRLVDHHLEVGPRRPRAAQRVQRRRRRLGRQQVAALVAPPSSATSARRSPLISIRDEPSAKASCVAPSRGAGGGSLPLSAACTAVVEAEREDRVQLGLQRRVRARRQPDARQAGLVGERPGEALDDVAEHRSASSASASGSGAPPSLLHRRLARLELDRLARRAAHRRRLERGGEQPVLRRLGVLGARDLGVELVERGRERGGACPRHRRAPPRGAAAAAAAAARAP